MTIGDNMSISSKEMSLLRTAIIDLRESAKDFELIIMNIGQALVQDTDKNSRMNIARENNGLARKFNLNLSKFTNAFAMLESLEIRQEAQQSKRRRPSQLMKSTRKRVATRTTRKPVRKTTRRSKK
jgi:hypothetical protein